MGRLRSVFGVAAWAPASDGSLPPTEILKLKSPLASVQVSPWLLPLQMRWMRTGCGKGDPSARATSPEKNTARSLVRVGGCPFASTPDANKMAAKPDEWNPINPPNDGSFYYAPVLV